MEMLIPDTDGTIYSRERRPHLPVLLTTEGLTLNFPHPGTLFYQAHWRLGGRRNTASQPEEYFWLSFGDRSVPSGAAVRSRTTVHICVLPCFPYRGEATGDGLRAIPGVTSGKVTPHLISIPFIVCWLVVHMILILTWWMLRVAPPSCSITQRSP